MKRGQRTLIGIDYGTRNIGIAIGQEFMATARPLTTIKAKAGKPDWDSMTRLIEQWQPDGFVVGWPLQLDGSSQKMTRAVQRFANQLKGRYHLPVYLMDERYTSLEADQIISAATDSIKKKKRAELTDQIAAQLILTSFFAQTQYDETQQNGSGLADN